MEFNELFDQSPVDWVKIKKRLLKNGHTMQTIYAAFKPTEGGGRIVVNVVDERLAKDLLRTITKIRSGDSRIEATKKGNSHRAKTSGGILNVYPAGQSFPQTVICSGNVYQSEFIPTTQALIIENIELFLRLEETLMFIEECCSGSFTLENMDIVFGSGNAIASSHNRAFLSVYQELFCLFDIDQGGLEAHKNLCAMLNTDKIGFLYPRDLNERVLSSARFLTPEQQVKLIKFKASLPIHESIKGLILANYKTLEQEDYLYG